MPASALQHSSDDLNEIARRGAYAWGTASQEGVYLGGFGDCLVWQDESFERDHNADFFDRRKFFQEIFPEPVIESSKWHDSRPRFSYLQSYWPAVGLPLRPSEASAKEKEKLRVKSAQEAEAVNHLAEMEGRTGLDSERRALKERLLHYGANFKRLCEEMLPLLQVWGIETEREILQGRSWRGLNPEDVFTAEGVKAYRICHSLWKDANGLWRAIVEGAPGEKIEGLLDSRLHREHTPNALADAQQQGVAALLEPREHILAKAAPLHRKWYLCELMREGSLRNGSLGRVRTFGPFTQDDVFELGAPRAAKGGEALPEPKGKTRKPMMKAVKAALEDPGFETFEEAIEEAVERKGLNYEAARRSFYRYLKLVEERTGDRPSDTSELLKLLRRVHPK